MLSFLKKRRDEALDLRNFDHRAQLAARIVADEIQQQGGLDALTRKQLTSITDKAYEVAGYVVAKGLTKAMWVPKRPSATVRVPDFLTDSSQGGGSDDSDS